MPGFQEQVSSAPAGRCSTSVAGSPAGREKAPLRYCAARRLVVGALLAAASTLAACGPRAVDRSVVMRDYVFDPAVIEVPAGAEVTLTAVNHGHHDHYWALLEKGYAFTLPFDDEDAGHILALVTADVGRQDTITFTAPSETGTYVVICSIPGHAEKGMLGSLIVK